MKIGEPYIRTKLSHRIGLKLRALHRWRCRRLAPCSTECPLRYRRVQIARIQNRLCEVSENLCTENLLEKRGTLAVQGKEEHDQKAKETKRKVHLHVGTPHNIIFAYSPKSTLPFASGASPCSLAAALSSCSEKMSELVLSFSSCR